MNKLILGIFTGVIIGLFFGYFITTKILSESIPKGYVRVTVTNKSGHNIKALILKHERGSIEMKDLPNQESANLIFKNLGENSYRINATLDNDSILSTFGEYVESGYIRTETIYSDKIQTIRKRF